MGKLAEEEMSELRLQEQGRGRQEKGEGGGSVTHGARDSRLCSQADLCVLWGISLGLIIRE